MSQNGTELRVSFRLARGECLAIALGMRIVLAHWGKTDLVGDNPELNTRIVELAALFDGFAATPAASHRAHLDTLNLALCQHALRCLWRAAKKGDDGAMQWPECTPYPRLMKRLEILRKRAQRRWLGHGDREAYARLQDQWRVFLRWREPRITVAKGVGPNLFNYFRQWRFEVFLDMVTDILRGRVVLPEERTLRRLVSEMKRKIRRGRVRGISLRACYQRKLYAIEFMREWMTTEIAKLRDLEALGQAPAPAPLAKPRKPWFARPEVRPWTPEQLERFDEARQRVAQRKQELLDLFIGNPSQPPESFGDRTSVIKDWLRELLTDN